MDNTAEHAPAAGPGEARNTDPKTVLVGMLASAQNAIIPTLLLTFSSGSIGLLIAIPVGLAIAAVGSLFAYIGWKRLTYTIGATDIRVESGVLSRSARSVPYERIQDVSLEQKLLPRLFGLVSVKFETGAGGGDDLSLSYLTEEKGEELRQLVRKRHEGAEADQTLAHADSAQSEEVATKPREEAAEALFTMGPGRLFTFGLFEFSLAVFAVLAGLLQYADSFVDFEVWDVDRWESWIEEYGIDVAALDSNLQLLGAVTGLIGVFVIGSLTGMIRVFTREWGFLLERTARGFRRRRGMFTRTDVVMPIHRVQGVRLGTGWLRYRFGWHGLSFVSLAQDMGASSHVVAPFAKLPEIAPIVEAAGFHLPGEDADWRRATGRYLADKAMIYAGLFGLAAIAGGIVTSINAPEYTPLAVGIPLALAAIAALANALAWRFQRHALDAEQIMATWGVLAPRSQIAKRLKLHSVEISQGPIARARGYTTVHLGQAGGTFSIPGVPVERARDLRRKVMDTIAATDFSQLETD
ncbi:MAG: PH domain-containing protein [Pseudomonadota bacterium]